MTRIAICRADSVVGRELLELLSDGPPPEWFDELTLLGAPEAGFVRYRGADLTVEVATPERLAGVDIALLGDAACVEAGAVAIALDTDAADAPVVLADLNPAAVDDHRGTIEVPDGGSIAVALLAAAVGDGLARVSGTVLQPVSVLGPQAIEELYEQTRALFAHHPLPQTHIRGRLAFSVLDGRPLATLENLCGVPVTLSPLLVPVFGGTTLSLELWFDREVSLGQLRERLEGHARIDLRDEVSPTDAVGDDRVLVRLISGAAGPIRVLAVADEVRLSARALLEVAREVVAQDAF